MPKGNIEASPGKPWHTKKKDEPDPDANKPKQVRLGVDDVILKYEGMSWNEFLSKTFEGLQPSKVRLDPKPFDYSETVVGQLETRLGMSAVNFAKYLSIKKYGKECWFCKTPLTSLSDTQLYDEYEYRTLVPGLLHRATLKKLAPICSRCYDMTDIVTLRNQGRVQEIAKYLVAVNGWKLVEATTYIGYEFKLYEEKRGLKWEVDITDYLKFLIAARKAHLAKRK